LRGYLRLCVSPFKGLLSVAVSAPNFTLPNFLFYCVYTVGLIHHVRYVMVLFAANVVKF